MISFGAINNLRKSATVKTIGIYTFTNFFTKGISFLLIPLFTNPKYLTPEDNGMLSLFNNASLFLMPFISLGLIQSTSTDFFKLNKKEFKDFFTTGFFLAIIMTIISIIVMLLLKDVLQNKFGLPNNLIWVIPLITFLTFCSEQIVRIIRNNNQPGIFMGIGIVKIIAELGIAVILIVGFAFGWYGRITGLIIALCLVTAYAVYYFLKKDYLVGAVKKKIY